MDWLCRKASHEGDVFGFPPGATGAGRETVAGVVRQAAPRPSYQQKLARALEGNPALLTGDGHLAPLRAIPRFIEMLHDAGVAGVVRPACGRCGRVVRIDKPLDGVRVCRTCIAHSRTEPCARCGAIREPVTRDGQGRPICANCFIIIIAPENLETCTGCGRVRRVERRTTDGPLCSRCPSLPVLACSVCGQTVPCGISRATGLHRALSGDRLSVPSLLMVSSELGSVIRERYGSDPAAVGYLDQLRHLRDSAV